MLSEKKRFTTFYKLTDSEINQIKQHLKEESPAELKKIIDKQAEQIKKLEDQLKTMKSQQNKQNKLLEEQKLLKNVSEDYENQLRKLKNQLQDLESKVNRQSYLIDNISYKNKSEKSTDEQTEKKFDDMSAKIDNLSSILNTKADKSEINHIEYEIEDLSKNLDKKADKTVVEKIQEKLEDFSNKFEEFKAKFTWSWDAFCYDTDITFILFTVILSIVLFLASNGLLIYLQIIGMPILDLWLDALILLGISALPFIILMVLTFIIGEPDIDVILVTLLILLIAAVVMVFINFIAFDILYYFVH